MIRIQREAFWWKPRVQALLDQSLRSGPVLQRNGEHRCEPVEQSANEVTLMSAPDEQLTGASARIETDLDVALDFTKDKLPADCRALVRKPRTPVLPLVQLVPARRATRSTMGCLPVARLRLRRRRRYRQARHRLLSLVAARLRICRSRLH